MVDDNKSEAQGSSFFPHLQQLQPSSHQHPQSNVPKSTDRRRVKPEDSVSLKHSSIQTSTLTSQPPKLKHASSKGEDYSHPDSGIGGSHGHEDSMEYSTEGVESDSKASEDQPRSRGSEGSKETIMSTAEDWFSDLNREVQVNNNYLDFDDDPPYYQPVSSSRRKHQLPFKQQRPHKLPRISGDAPSVRSSIRAGPCAESIVDDSGFVGGPQAHMLEGTSDSNSDSYRSVIDDLTIKNQKLKRRLRRLEELQAEHLQTDKLFELRIHGLSSTKRQELENLLQMFTSSLHNSPSSSSANSGLIQESPLMTSLAFNPAVTQIGDSAYASNSGNGSLVTPSVHPSISSSNKSQESGRNVGKIELPEKTKMKLVVKRLEELFTGRRQSIHKMTQNQQHAGAEDASTSGNSLQETEGAREASMMEGWPGSDTQRIHAEVQPEADCPSTTQPTSDSGLDQRPTRPFDLDHYREQIPSQNMEYLHNLTSSSGNEPIELDGQWDGWVYLNLITNMAQLHTINVTLPFVKKAIANMSLKLELSPDGKMVRWRGNDKNTSPNSGSPTRSELDSKSLSSRSPVGISDSSRGRIKAEIASHGSTQTQNKNSNNSRQSSNSRSGSGSGQGSSGLSGSQSFHYKPLFAQAKNSDDDSSEHDSSSSASSDVKSRSDFVEGEVSGDGRRTRVKSRFGPIIYYENGNFCTDLSAQEVVVRDESTTPDYPYERMTNEVVGAPGRRFAGISEEKFNLLHARGSFSRPLEKVVEREELTTEDEDMDEVSTMSFSPRLESTLPDHPPLPVELEASGIGGVTPEDNFAINVQIKHPLLPKGINTQSFNSRKLRTKLRGIIHRIPQSSINVFLRDESGDRSEETSDNQNTQSSGRSSPNPSITLPGGQKYRLPLRHELVSARFIRLPPSALPPASYMFFTPSSDDSSPDSDSGVNTRTSDSGQSMESRGSDDSGNDMEGTQSSPRGNFLASNFIRIGGSSSMDSPAGAPGKLALRARAADGIRETGLATTVGSTDYLSLINDEENDGIDSLDSDESMEDAIDSDENKSSDVNDQEILNNPTEFSRPMLKRMRNSKGSVDSLLAARKSKLARIPTGD